MPTTYNDGGVRFGSQIVTIDDVDGNPESYLFEGMTTTRGSNWTERQGNNGVPNGQFGVETILTGSGTLQIADETVKAPELFEEFTAVNLSGDSLTLVVSEVGEAFTHNGETKLTIGFRLVLNP